MVEEYRPLLTMGMKRELRFVLLSLLWTTEMKANNLWPAYSPDP
jgi:hypothetical protein